MNRRFCIHPVCLTVAAGLIIGRFSLGEVESPPSAPSTTAPAVTASEAVPSSNAGAIRRTIYVARHTTAQDLVTLLSQHFDSDPGVRLTAEPSSNMLVIRTPSVTAMDDAMKLLSMIDRPMRQIAFRVFVVSLTTNSEPAEADGARQSEVDTAELTGSADAVLDRLKAWAGAGHVASVKKYYLTVPENKIGELTLGEMIPMTSGYTMNASTRSSTPVVTMRDVGTTISLRPRISATNEIVADISFMESRLSPLAKGVELAKEGVNGPIVARGVLNTRLQTTLTIPDGQSIVAVESKDDSSPMLVVFAANIIDPPAVTAASASTSAASGAISRSQSNAPAQTGTATGNDAPATTNSQFRPGAPRGGGFQRPTMSLNLQLRQTKLRERLKLTEAQQEQVEKLRLEMFEVFRDLIQDPDERSKGPVIFEEFEKKYLDLLTTEQKQIWAEWQEELKKSGGVRSPARRQEYEQRRPDSRPQSDVPPRDQE